jgi:hypothetical protein
MKSFKLYLLVGFALTSIGCSKDEDTKPKVVNEGYSGTIQRDSNGLALMECTPFIAKMGSLNGFVKAFKNNDIYYSDKVDVKFNTSIDMNGKKLSFYRWKQQSNGNIVPDGNRLRFDITVNGRIYTNYTILTATAVGAVNTNQVSFTVHGTDIGYNAIQVQISDAANDEVQLYSDALIPFVHAHPKDYKAGHVNQNQLLALHPYINQATSNEDDEVFARRSYSDFCF